MWETGSYKQMSIRIGSMASAVGNPAAGLYFATEIQESARLTLGKGLILPELKVLLRSWDSSSLVIDTLGDWARGQNAAVVCFYLDFAAQNQQSPTSILSSLLKQVVGGLEMIPARIAQAFRDQKNVIGGRNLELTEIIDALHDISFSRPTIICIDALDECKVQYCAKLLSSLHQIKLTSPNVYIFLAGRLHILGEVESRLGEQVVAVSVSPPRNDITRFLRAKLKEDTTPAAMDKSLEEAIIERVPEAIPES